MCFSQPFFFVIRVYITQIQKTELHKDGIDKKQKYPSQLCFRTERKSRRRKLQSLQIWFWRLCLRVEPSREWLWSCCNPWRSIVLQLGGCREFPQRHRSHEPCYRATSLSYTRVEKYYSRQYLPYPCSDHAFSFGCGKKPTMADLIFFRGWVVGVLFKLFKKRILKVFEACIIKQKYNAWKYSIYV